MKNLFFTSLFVFFFSHCMNVAAEEFPFKLAWSTTDYLIDRNECPSPFGTGKSQQFTAWRGERLHGKIIVWSSEKEGEISFSVEEPRQNHWVDNSTTGFLRYVITDELEKDKKSGCGYRPDKTLYDSSLVADRIEPIRTIRYEAKTVQPVWITFDVPHDALPGLYRGSVSVKHNGKVCGVLPYSIRVINRTLPVASKQKFHLDLWQNPFAVARMAGVPLWSKEHFDTMRPLMERLAKAGQRGITTAITHKPWNGQTYDYFANMITEIRRVDDTWMYDYTVFDRWVEFMRSCGIGPYIYCYSVIPWDLTFHYFDQKSNTMVDRKLAVNNPEFDEYWVNKLKAFATHLKKKGWFYQTIIAMDERPKESMEAALRVIRKADVDYKISLAGNYHKELQDELFDLCIPYDNKYPEGVVDTRRSTGKITTFYTCCKEAFPNTFTFSQPIEASTFGLIAAERNLDGYLRWAYNSWGISPNEDTRFTSWAGGDTYIIYALNQSSVRFEKLIEGIQMFEKIQILKTERNKTHDISKLLEPFSYEKLKNSTSLQKDIKKINAYLNKDNK